MTALGTALKHALTNRVVAAQPLPKAKPVAAPEPFDAQLKRVLALARSRAPLDPLDLLAHAMDAIDRDAATSLMQRSTARYRLGHILRAVAGRTPARHIAHNLHRKETAPMTTTLYYKNGSKNSDKVYAIASDGKYVTAHFGRRGSELNQKTWGPFGEPEAAAFLAKKISAKMGEGYKVGDDLVAVAKAASAQATQIEQKAAAQVAKELARAKAAQAKDQARALKLAVRKSAQAVREAGKKIKAAQARVAAEKKATAEAKAAKAAKKSSGKQSSGGMSIEARRAAAKRAWITIRKRYGSTGRRTDAEIALANKKLAKAKKAA